MTETEDRLLELYGLPLAPDDDPSAELISPDLVEAAHNSIRLHAKFLSEDHATYLEEALRTWAACIYPLVGARNKRGKGELADARRILHQLHDDVLKTLNTYEAAPFLLKHKLVNRGFQPGALGLLRRSLEAAQAQVEADLEDEAERWRQETAKRAGRVAKGWEGGGAPKGRPREDEISEAVKLLVPLWEAATGERAALDEDHDGPIREFAREIIGRTFDPIGKVKLGALLKEALLSLAAEKWPRST